ncbi:MAG: hypothetical protein CMQ12_10330 [Gammaproteobacteria bacterium]|nr:hypothetical protein [Gammaproteobacteria bacterium]
MKPLLNTTLLFLLVIGFSGGASGQDFEETKRLAEQGDADAQFNLGIMYTNGRGAPENDVEAVRWFRLAAEQGYARAQFRQGNATDLPSGAGKHRIEKLAFDDDGSHLTYSYKLEDTEYLATPVTDEIEWAYRPDFEYSELPYDLEIARRFTQ